MCFPLIAYSFAVNKLGEDNISNEDIITNPIKAVNILQKL